MQLSKNELSDITSLSDERLYEIYELARTEAREWIKLMDSITFERNKRKEEKNVKNKLWKKIRSSRGLGK